MLNFRPMPLDQEETAASDDALLDQVVEAALIEAACDTVPELAVPPAAAGFESAEAFLQQAATFLNARTDCAELLERLRASITGLPTEQKPAAPSEPGASDSKPE